MAKILKYTVNNAAQFCSSDAVPLNSVELFTAKSDFVSKETKARWTQFSVSENIATAKGFLLD
ncbi:hypothetical protein [Kaarinaea lacus]